MPQTFEPDEFDRIAEQGGPVGVHRAPRHWFSRILPMLIAFGVAGLVAFAAATYYWQNTGSDPADVGPTLTTSPEATDSPVDTPSPSATATAEPEPEPSPEPVINLDANISVLNASGIGGLAGSNQEQLEAEGFTNVSAGNLTFSLPEENTVIYESDDQADTAARIAEILDIDNVEQGTPPGGAAIEVILRTDPDA